MGLRGEAAIVGYVELPPERLSRASPAPFIIEQWAELAAAALADAGLPGDVVNGIATSHLAESEIFVPSTVAEYLGIGARFAELIDLGGASAAAMVWRAAAAIELGICDAVLCALPARHITPSSKKKRRRVVDAMFFGSSSNQYGSPQAEFEIPYGNLGQNGPYGQVAQRYAAVYGYDERAMAKIVVDQRVSANHMDGAIWKDKPLTVEEVLASPVIADPLHMLEIVMNCVGGAAVVVANADIAKRARHRPVWVKGFGEHVPFKTPTYAEDLLHTPIAAAADTAFAMTDLRREQMDMVSIYDCYTITVLLSLEDAGFCEKGKG
ncbi:MAG TPA: thiolase family protein, partial [Mycobacterium sp.]|nr:thiolase family protein [Mycobacterium sp.]